MQKKYAVLPAMLLLLGALWYYSASILSAYAGMFEIDNARKGADAILILSGGVETRPDHAAKLVKEGYAQSLLITRTRDLSGKHADIFIHQNVLAQSVLAKYGLKATEIPSLKNGATSTFDEAYDLIAYMKTNPMKRIIVVTDAFHTSRAYYAFNKILRNEGVQDVTIEMSAAPNDIFHNDNWWMTERGITAYILEPIKHLFYRFSSRNASNIKEQ
ncbi:MAG: YdcF family protein [Sulfurimonadaceae bacterium]|nr:YdcF family protein [Sulfurimonadaceae bacterium]